MRGQVGGGGGLVLAVLALSSCAPLGYADVISTKVINNSGSTIWMTDCEDTHCEHPVGEDSDSVAPGQSYGLNAVANGTQYLALRGAPGVVDRVGSPVAGTNLRCALVVSGKTVAKSYPLTSLRPCDAPSNEI